MNIVAIIGARSGSKRLPGKNIRPLNGHPLMAYTIAAALEADIFKDVIVSSDSEEYLEIAAHYGASPLRRLDKYATDVSPDIDFVRHTLLTCGDSYDCYAILRPTHPFRSAEGLRRAWALFLTNASGIDSLRAVTPVREHPAKAWVVRHNRLLPLLPFGPEERPWHSSQYPSLPEMFIQDASMEIAWTRLPLREGTQVGTAIMPYYSTPAEAVDIDTEHDWRIAEQMLSAGEAKLPKISVVLSNATRSLYNREGRCR